MNRHNRIQLLTRNVPVWISASVSCLVLAALTHPVSAQSDATGIRASPTDQNTPIRPRPISVLPAGTAAADGSENSPWNRLILLATPKINSGQTEVLSDTIRSVATQCSLTVMATVTPPNETASQFQLTSIGVGYSAKTPQGQVIITSTSAAQQNAGLGFIGRQVLRTNEQQLSKVILVAQTSTVAIFDAPSVMLLSGKHVLVTTRHLLWIEPRSGKGAMLTWLLDTSSAPSRIVRAPLRLVPFSTMETRKIHVDGKEFGLLGIPSERAFALEDLPPGKNIVWTNPAIALAARSTYTLSQINALANAMNAAMNQAKEVSNAGNEPPAMQLKSTPR